METLQTKYGRTTTYLAANARRCWPSIPCRPDLVGGFESGHSIMCSVGDVNKFRFRVEYTRRIIYYCVSILTGKTGSLSGISSFFGALLYEGRGIFWTLFGPKLFLGSQHLTCTEKCCALNSFCSVLGKALTFECATAAWD